MDSFIKTETYQIIRKRRTEVLLQHLPSIYSQLKGRSQYLRRLPAKHHSSQENLKIIIHGTYLFIYLKIQGDDRSILFNLKFGFCYRIIHTVVDIKSGSLFFTNTASSHIRLISDNQSCGYYILRTSGGLIMVADGRYNRNPVIRRRPLEAPKQLSRCI